MLHIPALSYILMQISLCVTNLKAYFYKTLKFVHFALWRYALCFRVNAALRYFEIFFL